MEALEEISGGIRIRVRVVPKASRTAFTVESGGRLKVALTAPPVDGAANAMLIQAVAKKLGVAPRLVRIASGLKARDKTVEVQGVSRAVVETLLGLA